MAVSRLGRSFSGGGFKAQLELFVRSFGWNDINWAAIVNFQLGLGFIGWQL